jgi:5'-3' exonuclease
MKKLVVIDSGNIMFKSIFAFRTNSQVPAVYTYFRMIISYLKKLGVTIDDEVIIAQDFGSWRKAIDPLYKAQRREFRESKEDSSFWDEMFKEFNDFIPKLEICLPWKFIKIYKCESDDVASVAVRYIDAEEKILVSSDEDWQMLCSIPNVKVFSPYTKKFKLIKNPEKILLKKIQGDKSDNLLEAPKNEVEFEKRKLIVDLLNLPPYIEIPIKEALFNTVPRNLYLNKIPFHSCRSEIQKLYNL